MTSNPDAELYGRVVETIGHVERMNRLRAAAVERLTELASTEANNLVRDVLVDAAKKLRSETVVDEKWLTDLHRQRERYAPAD